MFYFESVRKQGERTFPINFYLNHYDLIYWQQPLKQIKDTIYQTTTNL